MGSIMSILLVIEGTRYEFESGYALRKWVDKQLTEGNDEIAGKVMRAYKDHQQKISIGLKDFAGNFEVVDYDQESETYTIRLHVINLKDNQKYLARFTIDKKDGNIEFHRLGESNR